MANPEVKQQQSFAELLENHTTGSPVGIEYAHGMIVRRVNSTVTGMDYNEDEGTTIKVDTLDLGHLVLVPNVNVNPNCPNEVPHQVCIREGEPRDFGTPIVTVSAGEAMGAMRFAHAMGLSIVAVPTWERGDGDIGDRVRYKIYAEKRPASLDEGTEGITDAGQTTAEQVQSAMQS